MKFLMASFIGLAILVWGVLAEILLTLEIHYQNTTIMTSTPSAGCSTGPAYGSLDTVSKTVSAEPSIYTIPSNYTVPGNASVEPIRWHLHSLQAFADKHTQTAHYAFEAVIKPNTGTVMCHAAVHPSHGRLDGVDSAACSAPSGLPPSNVSIPVTFHFAWRTKLRNSAGRKGNLLIIKSNSPGSAHACPNPPYDACWAQGLHWIPQQYIKPTGRGYKYVGPETLHISGTYCRTGMPECVWSEYLY